MIVEAEGTEMVHCSTAVVLLAEVQDFAEAHEAIELAADLDQD